MAKYEEGAVSTNGKWIVQGGTWVPNPAYTPTGTETAVAQSIEHGTPIQPPGLGQKALSAAGTALEYADIPFKPLHWLRNKAEQGMEAVAPGITKPVEVPIEGMMMGGPPTSGETVMAPGAGQTALELGELAAYGPYTRAGTGLVKQGIKGIKALRGVKPPEAPPLTEATADINASADALLKEMGLGQPAAAAEAAAPLTTPFTPPEPSMGPLFGGAREVAQRPPHLQVVKPTAPSAGAQGSLFPPAAISPPQYGPGRGPIGPPPPPPESFGGNVPRERLGTETARLKRAITDIERLRAIMGGK